MDNSDFVIEEPNISCISLDSSYNSDVRKEEGNSSTSALNLCLEDGEVIETENDNLLKETICEIKFPNKDLFEQFGPFIISSLQNTIDKQLGAVANIVEEESEDSVKLIVLQCDKINTKIPATPIPHESVSTVADNGRFEKETSPDLSGIKELFTIDTTPVPKIDSIEVPSYKRVIKDALLDEEAAAMKKRKEDEGTRRIKKNNCFNCGISGHSIRDCTRPHNAKRVMNAKNAKKVERYHVDVNQRFFHLKPGCISDKLRFAMGLRSGEIPFFFYRMRVLGYPPGWLEEAKVEHSGINLFNSDGSKILDSSEDEGEIDAINHKYNIWKIYDFPGFNQDPGENFFDDYKYHNVPPLDKRQMKEEFIKTLGANVLKGYKRKKLKDFPNISLESKINDTIHEATDMEIEEAGSATFGEVQFTRPPPPTDLPPSTPPPPPPISPASCESPINVSDRGDRDMETQSPSLLELEKRKQQLLHELHSNTTVIEIEDSLIDDIIELDGDDKKCEQNVNTNNTTDNNLESKEKNEKCQDTTLDIKESYMGTPVLQFSAYNNLPNGDNFKVGVSDVINFENLPDSIGKYEQMKEVIKKVRHCIHKLHSDEE